MRICHITTVHPPFDVRIFFKECSSLSQAGFETFLIAPHSKPDKRNGVMVIPLPKLNNRFFRMTVLPLMAFVKALKCRASVYHFHDPELLPVGILLKLFTFKKVIYDAHEDYFAQTQSKDYIPASLRMIISYSIAVTERISTWFFDGIITATDSINDKFSYHSNALCIHNYPVIEEEEILPPQKDQRYFTLVYTGAICRIRGITQVIKALELIPAQRNVKLVLCGEFESQAYREKIQQMKGYEKVEYPGWILPEKLKEIVLSADAGLVYFLPEPNHVDSMPNKIFEYMAAGIPVIASGFPLWKKIIEENKTGICADPLQPAELASAIMYLMDNPEVSRQMGIKGKEAVRDLYNWKREATNLIGFYKKMTE